MYNISYVIYIHIYVNSSFEVADVGECDHKVKHIYIYIYKDVNS